MSRQIQDERQLARPNRLPAGRRRRARTKAGQPASELANRYLTQWNEFESRAGSMFAARARSLRTPTNLRERNSLTGLTRALGGRSNLHVSSCAQLGHFLARTRARAKQVAFAASRRAHSASIWNGFLRDKSRARSAPNRRANRKRTFQQSASRAGLLARTRVARPSQHVDSEAWLARV